MNRSGLVRRVAARTGLSSSAARRVVDATLAELAQALAAEGRVTLSGFGTFVVRVRQPRTIRDPRTGAIRPVPARRVVSFRGSPGLRLPPMPD